MSEARGYIFVVQMSVDAAHEQSFLEEYDEHVRRLSAVPGVRKVVRAETVRDTQAYIDAQVVALPSGDIVDYIALYEIDSPDVLTSDAWRDAVDVGNWAVAVRPFTTDRRHQVVRILQIAEGTSR